MRDLKKKRNLFLVLFSAAVLAVGITGGAILAQENDTQDDAAHGDSAQDDSTRKSKASRVAEILGLGEEEVQDAFQQAGKEMRDERFQSRMDRLVEKGQITEGEAVEAVEWYQSRPENIGPGRRGFSMKGRGHRGPGARFGAFGMHGMGRFAHSGS
ncbi:MAG: hypothetical protein BZY80_07150 [SAR202 cluster bacterium Io17-Chloro-G2]|nr:MAG: hypothetical protein BZY80_07150 [SAR202 cluster bacterium Io17-Chloro-G2]